MDEEKVLVDWAVEIDAKLFTKLTKKIEADKEVPKDEMKLWKSVHLLPEKYNKSFVAFLENFINDGK